MLENSQCPSMFDSQSSQEFYSQSHMKMNSSREISAPPFANDYWSQSSSQDQESWRAYSKKPLLFPSKQQQRSYAKVHNVNGNNTMNQRMANDHYLHFHDTMQRKATEFNQRSLLESVEKSVSKQSYELKENLDAVRKDLVAELKSSVEGFTSNRNRDEKVLDQILTSINESKEELKSIEKLKESLAEKDVALKVKDETIRCLETTIDDLKESIRNCEENEQRRIGEHGKMLERVFVENTRLASMVQELLHMGQERKSTLKSLQYDSNDVSQQCKSMLEKEGMILEEIRHMKSLNTPRNHHVDRNNHWNRNVNHNSSCFSSPLILQPRFGAGTRPSPTAVVAPMISVPPPVQACSRGGVDVKTEMKSPKKALKDDDIFELSSDSDSGQDLSDIVNRIVNKKQNQTYPQPAVQKQKVMRKTKSTPAPVKSSTPTSVLKPINAPNASKSSTPVQRSIRRYGKIKKSVNPFSPIEKRVQQSDTKSSRGSLAKRRKLENIFNFDGDNDLRELADLLRSRKTQKKSSIRTY